MCKRLFVCSNTLMNYNAYNSNVNYNLYQLNSLCETEQIVEQLMAKKLSTY